MNEEDEWDRKVEADVVHRPMEKVTMEEVQEEIKHMKLGKTAGILDVAL